MLSGQQLAHATRFEIPNPVEKLAAADAHLFGNLRGGELATTSQTHGQQPLLVANVLTVGQRVRDFLGPFRSLQMKSFWHPPFIRPKI